MQYIIPPTPRYLSALSGSYSDFNANAYDDELTISTSRTKTGARCSSKIERGGLEIVGTKEQNQSRRLHKMVGLLTPPSTDIELDDEDSQAEIVRAGGFRSMKVDDNYTRHQSSSRLFNPDPVSSPLIVQTSGIRMVNKDLGGLSSRSKEGREKCDDLLDLNRFANAGNGMKGAVPNKIVKMEKDDVLRNEEDVVKKEQMTLRLLYPFVNGAEFSVVKEETISDTKDVCFRNQGAHDAPINHDGEIDHKNEDQDPIKQENDDNEEEEIILFRPITSKPSRPRKRITIRDVSHPSPNPIRIPRGPILQPTFPSEMKNFRDIPRLLVYDKMAKVAKELVGSFPYEKEELMKIHEEPESVEREGRIVWDDGVGRLIRDGDRVKHDGNVHLFLDHSNIYNTFLDSLPITPTTQIGKVQLSLPLLTLLLLRGRSVATDGMHLVGSSPLQQELEPAVRLGWTCNVLKRVSVTVPAPEIKIRNRTGGVTLTEASSSDTDWSLRPSLPIKKMREQAVDELLHLKLLQTLLLSNKPGTIVLATGDAKASQFNEGGFLSCVREALKRGWKVELWSFKRGLSRLWIDTAKREGWTKKGGFVLWALDNWLDELTECQRR